MKKKRALVVAPGRGTYNKETLGYLKKFNRNSINFLEQLDKWKKEDNEITVSELDNSENFKNQVHTKGENASLLIFACSYADFLNINREEFDIVAVTGNSMGWYSTLVLGESLDLVGGYKVINTMGSMMKKEIIGGQIIYPITNEDWTYDLKQKEFVLDLIKECVQTQNGEAYVSIHLGGYLVIGGDHKGLSWLLKKLPQKEHFPFQLLNHAAFHTPLLKGTSELAFQMISPEIFRSPKIPMIDGRGHIWQPYSSDPLDIYTYTLGHQVCEVYDYSVSITVGLKEFAPDAIILLGPGNTLGGTTGQILVNSTWRGIKSKESFQSLQKTNPFIVSMGL